MISWVCKWYLTKKGYVICDARPTQPKRIHKHQSGFLKFLERIGIVIEWT